ncbi:MAG: DUF3313 family protein [Halieaceae bacterium]
MSKPRVPEKGDPAYFKVRDSMADQVYVNEDPAKKGWIDTVRRIYIAPVNTSRTQIVQPHGVDKSDLDAWEMTAEEEQVINSKFAREMTRALEADQAFHVVGNPAEAQAELHAKLIAIHPYQPRSVVESGGKGGGAVTMSFALVDPADNAVMIRALDSKSTDNIWAFHNMKTEMTALDLIFGLWGHQVRRSILFLQGRLDSAPPPILLKPQQ